MNAARDFNKATIKALANKGMVIYSSRWIPGECGSFANGERGYLVNDNDCSRLLTYREVMAEAQS